MQEDLIYSFPHSDRSGRSWPQSIEDASKNYPRHYGRYSFALQFVHGKKVCDSACGVGYGSHLMAEKAKKVIGLDVSEKAIEWAKRCFKGGNIKFLVSNVVEKWLIEAKFDVIVSFETMEHLISPERFLDNVNEHLLPGGTLILSVPNGHIDLKNHSNNNNHLQYFSDTDLKKLMESRFSSVEYLTQIYRKNLKHYAKKWLRKTPVQSGFRLVENFNFVPGLLPDKKTWLAVAHK